MNGLDWIVCQVVRKDCGQRHEASDWCGNPCQWPWDGQCWWLIMHGMAAAARNSTGTVDVVLFQECVMWRKPLVHHRWTDYSWHHIACHRFSYSPLRIERCANDVSKNYVIKIVISSVISLSLCTNTQILTYLFRRIPPESNESIFLRRILPASFSVASWCLCWWSRLLLLVQYPYSIRNRYWWP